MQLTRAFTVTFIFALASTVSASFNSLNRGAEAAVKSRDAITATWEETGSLSPDLYPRMNQSEGDVDMQKRKVAADPYAVPYPLQTGLTRYAPMAKKPGTAIATTPPTPQFPSSPYIVATKYMSPATVETTLTASETVSVTMVENTVCDICYMLQNPHPLSCCG